MDAQPPLVLQAPLAATLSILGDRPWKYAPRYRALQDRRVRTGVKRLRPDAVLEIADLVVPTVAPTYSYQDSNFAVAIDYHDALGPGMVSTIPSSRSTLQRLADEQHEALQKIQGVFAMGQWFCDYLVSSGTLSARRVHAVGGGISPEYCDFPPRQVRPRAARDRILFVGGDFLRKGGDVLVAAIDLLNRQGSRPLRLTVVGPEAWPMERPPPAWLDFRGRLGRDQVRDLMGEHDLFAMPSRFEAYGIAFLEARAAGLPCIGRKAFAMPELIEPGIGGAVWDSDKVEDLAQLIQTTLDDDALHAGCARDAQAFARANAWTRVAERMTRYFDGSAGAPPRSLDDSQS